MSTGSHLCEAPDEVREELSRVLASTEFLSSRQLTRFLQFIVEEALAGREERLKERNIARRALDRDSDFDPRLDCIVRVVAGKLRRALERYYATEGAAEPLRIEVPKGAYRPIFRRTAIVADVNAATTDAIQSSSPATNEICPMGYPVVAVVPFATFTQGERERFIADALAEDMSVRLSQLSWFQVVDCLSTRSLPTKSHIPHEFAARLRADYFLTGTVRRQNVEDYRVTVKLAHTGDARLIWAGTFDVDGSSDVQDGLDTVVNRVAVAVGDLFGVLATSVWSAARRKRTEGMTAVEAVLRQMHYQTHLSDAMHNHTFKAVERAVRDHSDFAWGWAALATLHVDDFALLVNGGAAASAELCRECCRRALRADPTCAYAHWNVAIYEFFEGRTEESIEGLHRTLDHAQGSPFEVGAVGAALNGIGEVHQGQPLIDQALQINPRLPGWIHWGAVLGHLAQGDSRAAIAATEQFSMPNCFWDPMLRAVALAGAGEKDEKLVEQALRLRPELSERPRELGGMIIKQPEILDQFVDCIRATRLSVS